MTKQKKVLAKIEEYEFSANGKTVVDKGYTKYLEKYQKQKEDTLLPDVNVGDVLSIRDVKINEKYTTPPKHFTEDTLLNAMEVAGNDELDSDMEVERKGLGIPATRAGAIENLISKEYVKKDKKKLIAINKGMSIITLVKDEFKKPKTTAVWKMRLSDIANGRLDKDNFLRGIEKDIKETVELYKNKN